MMGFKKQMIGIKKLKINQRTLVASQIKIGLDHIFHKSSLIGSI